MTGIRGIIPSSILLFIILCMEIHDISALQTGLDYSCDGGSSTPAFQTNLNTIISSVSTNINNYGFYNATTGVGVDQVNTIALCRGDIDLGTCRECVQVAAKSLTTKSCPNKIEAIVWYVECMFRYSNNPILGIMSLYPSYVQDNHNDAANITLFTQEVTSFADSLVGEAYKGTYRKFAAKKSSKSNTTIYGFMQCTPDITPDDCKSCLKSIAINLSSFYHSLGAKYITPSCSFRYEIYPFIHDPSNPAGLPPQ